MNIVDLDKLCEMMAIFGVGCFCTQDDLEDKLGEEIKPNDSIIN